jgi:hypothetical protein
MKRFTKLFIIFCLSGIANNLFAQIPYAKEPIDKEVEKLRSLNADSIITFTRGWYMNNFQADSLAGLGEIYIDREEYLLYRSDNKTYSKKLITYHTEKLPSGKIAISNPFEVKSDSLFLWLGNTLEQIKTEEIYPYIYKFIRNDSVCFNYFLPSHPAFYSIEIYSEDERIRKSVCWDCLQERYIFSEPINLNYTHNINTKLYSLFTNLYDLFEQIDKQFQFTKLKR